MKKIAIVVLSSVCALLLVPAFAGSDIQLKKADLKFGTDLGAAISARKSVREFSAAKIKMDDLAVILWAAYGTNRADGKHTVPTAFGRDVLRIYVVLPEGTYSYNPAKNTLKLIVERDIRSEVATQGWVKKAPAVLVITADTSEYPIIMGKQERINYSYASAGGAAQNVYLACTALKMGTCLVAGVDSDGVKKHIPAANKELPLFVMPIGYLK